MDSFEELHINFDEPLSLQRCRTCMSSKENMTSIFDPSLEESNFLTKLLSCALIEISECDELPNLICDECINNVNISYMFRLKCENAERSYHELLKKHTKTLLTTVISPKPSCMMKRTCGTIKKKDDLNEIGFSPEADITTNIDNHQSTATENENGSIPKFRSVMKRSCGTIKQFDLPDIKDSAYPGNIIHSEKLETFSLNDELTPPKLRRVMKRTCGTIRNDENLNDIIKNGSNITNIDNKPTDSKNNVETIESSKLTTTSKKYICDVCSKVSETYRGHCIHMVKHKGKQSSICEICNKTVLSGMVVHMRTHTGEKPFKCLECGKSYSKSSGLNEHKITHLGLKPYECNTCKRCFGTKRQLEVHSRTHTGLKPHLCNECGKGFSQLSTLVGHMRTHTGE